MTELLNLFIDESGTYYIGEPRFRFFILTGVILNNDQSRLADIMMSNWRSKYLTDSGRCFHAAEFFQPFTDKYNKKELNMTRNFNKATKELIAILENVNPEVITCYVDLKQLRYRLSVKEPPKYQPKDNRSSEYKAIRNEYRKSINNAVGKKQSAALSMTLNKVLEYHRSKLSINNNKGYINIESLADADKHFISVYHKQEGAKIPHSTYKYGEKILGVNFHTKGSLSGGIELADLISYVFFQSLRSKHKCLEELKDISKRNLDLIRNIRDYLRKDMQISPKNVSNEEITSI